MEIKVKLNISPLDLMREAIEAGVNRGYYRAFKHVSEPSEDEIKRSINNEVYNELSALFSFEIPE